MHKFIFLALLISLNALAGEIKVTHALWGTHDATAKAAAFCDGKNDCYYKISEKYVGDVGSDASHAFALTYLCETKGQPKTAGAAAGTADGTVLHLSCPVTPLTPAQMRTMFGSRTAMFRQVMMDPARNGQIVRDLGQACVDAVNAVTRKGQTLRSQEILKAVSPLSSMKFPSGVQDDTFFHYTSAAELVNMFKLGELQGPAAYANAIQNHLFEQEFNYLRTIAVDSFNFWRRVFYVAEDPVTSASYGNYEIEFKLDMSARTLMYKTDVWTAALNEIGARYPDIASNCKLDLHDVGTDYGTVESNDILFVIAEDSGVSVINYGAADHWYQVIAPQAFRGIRLVPKQ